MKKISEVIGNKDYITEVVFKDLTFVLRYISKTALLSLMERCTTAEYDSKLKGRVPKLDSTRFTNAFAEATIVGWKGVTYRKLIKSGILPIDIEQIPEEDRDVEIPFEVGEAAKLLEKAYDLDKFIQDSTSDFSIFAKVTPPEEKAALLKN